MMPLVAMSQSPPFLGNQEKVLRNACEQWMCKELIDSNPQAFKSSNPENPLEFSFPASQIQHLNIAVNLKQAESALYQQLYFPGNNGLRFLTLKSLCDLYFPLFERKLSIHQLPEEYKYLPLVLSGLNPHHTDASDNAGLWSLDYLVARSLHLRVDSLIDDRRGADFTTEKVLDHLQTLHWRYKGDHLKVLLAYIRSVPFVEKHLAQHGDILLDELESSTRQLLQLFVYTIELFERNEAENHLVHYFDILGNYENIFFERGIPLQAMKEVLGANVQQLQLTNPVYCGSRIDSTYRGVAFILEKQIAAKYHLLKDSLHRWKPAPPPAPVVNEFEEEKIYYTVRKGDSLGKIAQKYKVSVSQLKKWNKLKRDRINVGQKLVIIRKQKVKPTADKKEVIPNSPDIETPKTVDEPDAKSNPVKKEAQVSSTPKTIKYKVRSGDSMWLIAKKYPGVTAEDIMKWNKCNDDIRPGQILVIYPKK